MEIFDGVRDARAITASWRDKTTPSGHTARWVTRPRPGSPPRVPWSPLFLNPHIAWYRKSNPVNTVDGEGDCGGL
jgi:hypothetical protein